MKKLSILLLLLLGVPAALHSQNSEPADSLVRLMSAQSVRMVQKDNENYREVIGPARFLHNNTYLICDTAHWNVDTRIITAIGNVQIIQKETVLTSDNLEYVTDLDLARFRGSVVQLTDKEHNTLRTCHLDYNTKDSIAVFDFGGSLKDKDGQVIESTKGTYDSKIKTFTFEDNVNMYADSLFIKSSMLAYNTDEDRAVFDEGVDAWKDDNMVSSRKGWYNKREEILLFHDDAHVLTKDQEGWSDSLYYFRNDRQVEMHGNAQVTDTVKNVSAVGHKIVYVDSLSRVTLTGQAAVIARVSEKKDSVARVDTVYMGADRIVLLSRKMYEMSPADTSAAYTRVRDMSVDPVEQYRIQCAEAAAEAARKAQEEKLKSLGMTEQGMAARAKQENAASAAGQGTAGDRKQPKEPERLEKPGKSGEPEELQEPDESETDIPAAADSTFAAAPDSTFAAAADSTFAAASDSTSAAAADSTITEKADSLLTGPLDSTEVRMIRAIGNVRVFKSDMQARCDSLDYCDLDSLARMFISPVIWNEGRRQYIADSIFISVRGSKLDKASLMSNAFITIQEDSLHFDQIRSTEMMAYFDTTSALRRFDALGDAAALFYMKENKEISTVNKVQTRMLSANFKKGDIDRIYYYDSPKNDAYPVVQLPRDERQMKGFSWDPERRPSCREDITTCVIRDLQRAEYLARPRTSYVQTDRFFPGYMKSVYDGIEAARRREAERRSSAADASDAQTEVAADSLSVTGLPEVADSTATAEVSDTLAKEPVPAADSLGNDSSAAVSEREAKRLERERKREERYRELDRRDAEKAAAKEAKAKEKQRRKALKFLQKEARREAREEAAIQRYMRKYEQRLQRKSKTKSIIEDGNEEKSSVPAGELPPGVETGREISAASEPGK